MKNGKSVMCVKWVFCMTDTNNATMKEKCKEEGGEDESEIYTAMRRSVNSSQKKKWPSQTISLNKRCLCK